MTVSIKRRFIVGFSGFVLFSCALISIIAGFAITKVGVASAINQAAPVVQKATKMIDGDDFERICREMNPEDERTEETRKRLMDLAVSTGCQYLYTMVPKNPTTYIYVIDGNADPSDQENFTEMGTEEDITDWGTAPGLAYTRGIISNSKIEHHEEWGWQVSVYGPIRNSNGRTVGIIGCDYKVDYIIKMTQRQVAVISIVGLACVILGGFLVSMFSSSIFGALKKVSKAMEMISQGSADLTQRIPEQKNVELGSLTQNCNKVIQRLSDLMKELQNQSEILKSTGTTMSESMGTHIQNINYATRIISDIEDQIASQTDKITKVSESTGEFDSQISTLNTRIIAQTEAIEQASSAIEEISANIQQVNRNVAKISTEYASLTEKSAEGNRLQQDVSEQLEQIVRQSANLNEANTAISGIAEQTNLLAMNAAIEAAHAGELGKGFSVVADEIRVLAETASTQSNAIRELLEGISSAIQGIVESSEKSSTTFENVGSKISEMDDMMREIKLGMEEENEGVNNILETVKTIDGTTHSIAEASKTMKKESSNISAQVSELRKTSNDTHVKSVQVLGDMMEINAGAVSASEAADKNKSASDHIIEMITEFKVE